MPKSCQCSFQGQDVYLQGQDHKNSRRGQPGHEDYITECCRVETVRINELKYGDTKTENTET